MAANPEYKLWSLMRTLFSYPSFMNLPPNPNETWNHLGLSIHCWTFWRCRCLTVYAPFHIHVAIITPVSLLISLNWLVLNFWNKIYIQNLVSFLYVLCKNINIINLIYSKIHTSVKVITKRLTMLLYNTIYN